MNRFREARLNAHLSQKAAAISLGIKPPSMSGWESGDTKPTLENLKAMAALYGVTVDYLLGSDEPQNEKKPTVVDDGLLEDTIRRVQTLPEPALARVQDFLDGLEAGLSVGSAAPAAAGPADGSAE